MEWWVLAAASAVPAAFALYRDVRFLRERHNQLLEALHAVRDQSRTRSAHAFAAGLRRGRSGRPSAPYRAAASLVDEHVDEHVVALLARNEMLLSEIAELRRCLRTGANPRSFRHDAIND